MSSPGRGSGKLGGGQQQTFPPLSGVGTQQTSPLRSEFVVSVGSAKISNSNHESSLRQNGHERHKSEHSSLNNRIRKVEFRDNEDESNSEGAGYTVSRGSSGGSGGGGGVGDRGGSGDRGRRATGDEVDRMLDGMREGSSDEDEIEIITTPRRRAVGRVG